MSAGDQALIDSAGMLAGQGISGQLPAHLFMPPDGIPFDPTAYISLPAIGTTSTVLQLPAQQGYLTVLRVLANVFVGTGWTEGSGALVWQLLDNGGVVRNYDNIVSSLGAVNNPRALGGGGGILIQEAHLIQLTVKNVSVNVGGALSGARLGGWYIPVSRMPDELSIF